MDVEIPLTYAKFFQPRNSTKKIQDEIQHLIYCFYVKDGLKKE